MLISTMGFSINTLYCICTGQYRVSFVEKEDCCKVKTEKNNCFNNTCTDGCTKNKKTEFVKADLKYLETTKDNDLPHFDMVADATTIDFAFDNGNFQKILTTPVEYPTQPPPKFYGRFLLNFIQVYRI